MRWTGTYCSNKCSAASRRDCQRRSTLLQVLGMCIAHDPSGHALKATFHNSSTFRFQDGVGQSLLRLARIVPDGLLVFMPSYGMMAKLMERWQTTGTLPHAGCIVNCIAPMFLQLFIVAMDLTCPGAQQF
jgi:Helicase C-terminal domain